MAKISQEIDKITNSIEHRSSGDSLQTEVKKATLSELKKLGKRWNFDWVKYYRVGEVYKLVLRDSAEQQIQGLICIERKPDHIFMHLIESAPHNRGQKTKSYYGVPANLVAYACKESWDMGFAGIVAFQSKSNLINHYKKTLKATQLSGQNMFIDTPAAAYLINNYNLK